MSPTTVADPSRPTELADAPSFASPATAVAWAQQLSAREIEVLQCIAAGLSTTEIAQTLFISIATVRSHIARLILKVGVRDRIQLVIAAYRSGFVRVS